METLPGRSKTPGRDLDQPQEPGVFHNSKETQLLPGSLVSLVTNFIWTITPGILDQF